MMIYLTLSLLTSFAMNRYNARIALVGRNHEQLDADSPAPRAIEYGRLCCMGARQPVRHQVGYGTDAFGIQLVVLSSKRYSAGRLLMPVLPAMTAPPA